MTPVKAGNRFAVAVRTGRDIGCIAWYNGDAYRPARERSVLATHNKTTLHYLELLDNIASGERRAGVYLQAWADTTPDPELQACLSMVANRETSHYHIFKRCIAELGYPWTDNQDPDFAERLKVSGSDMPDVEKIRWAKARQAQRQGPTIRERYEAAIADEDRKSVV